MDAIRDICIVCSLIPSIAPWHSVLSNNAKVRYHHGAPREFALKTTYSQPPQPKQDAAKRLVEQTPRSLRNFAPIPSDLPWDEPACQ
jgi:hypothetical protein